nr:unnamed protein product [Callosobruchus chinensis]
MYRLKKDICPARTIQYYLIETKTIKNCTGNFFITYKKPIRNATAAGWTQKSLVFANFYQRPLASKQYEIRAIMYSLFIASTLNLGVIFLCLIK